MRVTTWIIVLLAVTFQACGTAKSIDLECVYDLSTAFIKTHERFAKIACCPDSEFGNVFVYVSDTVYPSIFEPADFTAKSDNLNQLGDYVICGSKDVSINRNTVCPYSLSVHYSDIVKSSDGNFCFWQASVFRFKNSLDAPEDCNDEDESIGLSFVYDIERECLYVNEVSKWG